MRQNVPQSRRGGARRRARARPWSAKRRRTLLLDSGRTLYRGDTARWRASGGDAVAASRRVFYHATSTRGDSSARESSVWGACEHDAAFRASACSAAKPTASWSLRPSPPEPVVADPTLGTQHGCGSRGSRVIRARRVSVETEADLGSPDPAATRPRPHAPHLARIRRDWFDRYLENADCASTRHADARRVSARQAATLTTVLDGDPRKQKEALWAVSGEGQGRAESGRPPPRAGRRRPRRARRFWSRKSRFACPTARPSSDLRSHLDTMLLVYDLAESQPVALSRRADSPNVRAAFGSFIASAAPWTSDAPRRG